MFVQTEVTPNPNSLKFLPGKIVSNYGSFEVTKKEETNNELIRNLLSINGVEGIFLGKDFISVNKYENTIIDKMIYTELRSLLEKKLLFTMDPKPKFKSKIMRDNDIISFFVNPKITVFFMDNYH